MILDSLGYVVVASDRTDEWEAFGSRLIGMQAADRRHQGFALRMDDRRQRLMIAKGAGEGVQAFGWELPDAAALDRLGARVDDAGVQVKRGDRVLAAQRGVADLLVFADPMGNRLEAFHGPALAETPFIPGRAISGFRTGALGLGHAVLTTADIAAALPFYQDLLGFRLSDYTLRPFKAYFFHLNARHHSFALVETGQIGVHHIMVEVEDLDMVGYALDTVERETGETITLTLGKHTNDRMTSFYVTTPAGFDIEYGCGGVHVDDRTWTTASYNAISFWGHKGGPVPPSDD